MGGPMAGKVVLVTGATSGIGKVTAARLAELGAHVVLVARDAEKGAATVAEIRDRAGDAAVDLLLAELASQPQVRALAAAFRGRFSRLDVLVNNAGAALPPPRRLVDGIENTFALNHLAPFLLTHLLLDLLVASAPARVVTVASSVERYGRIPFDDLNRDRGYRGLAAYSQSKLANVLFTYALSRRLDGTGVTANALHPGVVRTGFYEGGPALRAAARLGGRFFRTPEQGAQTVIGLASSAELAGVTGRYFVDGRPARSSRRSRDPELAERLWRVSEDLVGLPASERLDSPA